jgi:hypothetical protein
VVEDDGTGGGRCHQAGGEEELGEGRHDGRSERMNPVMLSHSPSERRRRRLG